MSMDSGLRSTDESVALAIEGGAPVRRSRLPLTRPWMGEAEAEAAAQAVRANLLIGGGPAARVAEAALATHLDGARPLFLNSCSSALEASVLLSGVGPGDEVVLPSFTFVSCANAVVRAGARPVFADLDPATLNIDPAAIARVDHAADPRRHGGPLRGTRVRHDRHPRTGGPSWPARHRRCGARARRAVAWPAARHDWRFRLLQLSRHEGRGVRRRRSAGLPQRRPTGNAPRSCRRRGRTARRSSAARSTSTRGWPRAAVSSRPTCSRPS